MAIGFVVRAFTQAASRIWNTPMTLGRHVAAGAVVAGAPIALAVIDHENDGALSYAAFKTTVGYLKDKIKEGASPQAIESAMEAASYVADVSRTFRKGAQSLYVEQRMQQKEGAEAILTGKRAAVEFQLLPDNMASLVAKQAVRTAIADDLFKGDRNAADKYLANALVDDIVKNAQVIPLEGNQVSRDDVKAVLVDVVNNPDKHPLASRFFGEQDRLMNGLRQVWPELSVQAPAAVAKVEEDRKQDEGLSGIFGMAANGESSLMKIFTFFLAMMAQMLGFGKPGSVQPASQEAVENEARPSGRPAPALRPGF